MTNIFLIMMLQSLLDSDIVRLEGIFDIRN
jgi:hypothetical protein